jgi:fatty acyl-CoA reductase
MTRPPLDPGDVPISSRRPASVNAAAFFDVDGTLVQGTVVHYYAWLSSRSLSFSRRALRTAHLAARLPHYWWLDRRGRDRFLRAFYRNYAGYALAELRSHQEALFREVMEPRLLPEGIAAVRAHQAAGQRVVILSASLRFVLEPLASYLDVDELICQELAVRDGVMTGDLEGPPLDGEERAQRLREYAEGCGLDLSASYAYADSAGDVPMLAAVGHPVAVNPSRGLLREAERRGWPVRRWGRGR